MPRARIDDQDAKKLVLRQKIPDNYGFAKFQTHPVYF